MTAYDVLLVGDYWYDLVFTGLPEMPRLGAEVYAEGFADLPGGPFNIAAALQRMGLRVGWAADFGSDAFSRLALAGIRAEGLDERLFVIHDRPYRRVTASASFPHDRSFLSYSDLPPEAPAGVQAMQRVEARLLMVPGLLSGQLLDGYYALVQARQMQVTLDCQHTSFTLADPAVRRMVERADVFMPNAAEACHLTGAGSALEALHALAEVCPVAVVKDGANGAYGLRRGESSAVHAPALPVQVMDTTGAGDAFNAGFIKAWLDGRPLAECLRWGNICGGLSATARGGATAAPTLAEVQRWLAQA